MRGPSRRGGEGGEGGDKDRGEACPAGKIIRLLNIKQLRVKQ